MPIVHITRRERFSAAQTGAPDWSPEKNLGGVRQVRQPQLARPHHDLWVTVKGEPDPETSFVTDLSAWATW